MKISYNPIGAAAVTTTTAAAIKNDILFDLGAKKIWAKGLRMGADWEDISSKPSSLKNPTALTTFGVVYDGSVAKTVTPSNFIDLLLEGTSAVTDGTMFITSVATNNGFSDTGYVNIPYKRKASCLWDYIKTKTDALYSVIGHNHDDRYLKLTGGILTGNLTGTSAIFSGRFYGNGDDEGIIIKPAANGYAGLILGTHNGERSVFYFTKGKPFWRYNDGSVNSEILHPKKSGIIALISDIPNKNSWNYDDRYLKLTGGTMTSDALITFADSETQGDRGGFHWAGQSDWVKLYASETAENNLDLVIQFGDDNSNGLSIRNKSNLQTSYISADGTAKFGNMDIKENLNVLNNIYANYNISVGNQIYRGAKSISWYLGREGALLRETSVAGYHTLWSLKTTNGSWEFGEYNYGNDWDNVPLLSYVTDTDFNNGNNAATYQIKFPLASGTVALTSLVSSFDVNTALYLRSLGTKNCLTGRTQDYGDVYSYSTGLNNTGAPTTYTSVMGFGRGIAGTVEIAGGWCNTGLYWRSLRDCCEDWYSWRTVLDDSNYTEFVDNYYWANVKISTTSSTTTSPTVSDLIATNSIRMGDIYLLNSNEINNSNSNLYLNYSTTTNINMCHGGGAVIVGPMVDNIGNNKLYVNGSTTLNSTATFNGLVTNNGGILPASYDVNNNGIACYVWGDAMSTGVTAITDALDPRYVTVTYSLDNGATWTNYTLTNYEKFSLYANNGSYVSIYLGQNRTPDSNGTPSLAQVLKNQLIITFEIPNSLYSELCWASVDIGAGVLTICTVEIISVSGAIMNTFTKNMYGWNKFNYINFMGNSGASTVDIGKNDARFVRFKFKHDPNNTAIRNAQIRKIRLFSFTKYNIDSSDFRSIMGNTGHLYKYDENLNVTFPNTLKTTALEVSGNASFYDLYCNTLNHTSPTGTLIIGDKTREVGIRSSNNTTLNALYLYKKLSSNVCFSANLGFCITPIFEGDYLSNRVNVNGNTYGNIKVGGDTAKTQTISCLIHRVAIPNVRGLLVDFARGMDGQILILKNTTTNDLYIRPLFCSIILPNSRNSYLTSGNMDTIVGQNSSHFFVYSEAANAWMWFRCN